jgi:UDP-N-acetylglucosamine 2-epimerase (non-hydrolysing)
VPEEINRRVVDHISDINLAYTENARHYLLEEGIGRDTVYVTGSPMTEVLTKNHSAISNSTVLGRLNIERRKYFVISMHREENVDIPVHLWSLCHALNQVAEEYAMPMIFSTHPRTKNTINSEGMKLNPLICQLAPMGFFDYNRLQKDAYCVLSDSGTVSEESAILNFPGVSIRTSTERPEALDAGSVVLGGIDTENIRNAIDISVGMHYEDAKNPVRDYLDSNVSEKVVRIIQSYCGIVDARVWCQKQLNNADISTYNYNIT